MQKCEAERTRNVGPVTCRNLPERALTLDDIARAGVSWRQTICGRRRRTRRRLLWGMSGWTDATVEPLGRHIANYGTFDDIVLPCFLQCCVCNTAMAQCTGFNIYKHIVTCLFTIIVTSQNIMSSEVVTVHPVNAIKQQIKGRSHPMLVD